MSHKDDEHDEDTEEDDQDEATDSSVAEDELYDLKEYIEEEEYPYGSKHSLGEEDSRDQFERQSDSTSNSSSCQQSTSAPPSPAARSRETLSSFAFRSPPSFLTPPIPETKTTPFLRMKRDQHSYNFFYVSSSSSSTTASSGDLHRTPRALSTPGHSTLSRFHTPPLPSPGHTTPFFAPKKSINDGLKWTQPSGNLWFNSESFPFDCGDTETWQQTPTFPKNEPLRTPPFPSPTRTITFYTPYTAKKNDSHPTEQEDQVPWETNQELTVRGPALKLPPSPEFPSPLVTTMFLYYWPNRPTKESSDHVEEHVDPAKQKNESTDSAINDSDFEREKARLELEFEQEILRVAGAQASPASLPPTSTFNFGMSAST